MNVNKDKLFVASLIFVFIGIAILSLLPPKSIEKIGEHDKINHFIAYAVLSLNVGLVVKKLKTHLLCLPLLIGYGILLEYCQGFVPGRQPSLLDALANSIGVSIGFILYLLLSLKKKV
ncbi:MAG: VanZ family protein [Crocinitomicaceae bacterium]|jgi:VanZ family protein